MKKLTLIDFWAEWCQPCKKLSPLLDRLVQEFSDQIDLVKVDADQEGNFDLLAQYNIKSIPTLILLLDNEVMGTIVGIKPEDELRAWLQVHVSFMEQMNA